MRLRAAVQWLDTMRAQGFIRQSGLLLGFMIWELKLFTCDVQHIAPGSILWWAEILLSTSWMSVFRWGAALPGRSLRRCMSGSRWSSRSQTAHMHMTSVLWRLCTDHDIALRRRPGHHLNEPTAAKPAAAAPASAGLEPGPGQWPARRRGHAGASGWRHCRRKREGTHQPEAVSWAAATEAQIPRRCAGLPFYLQSARFPEGAPACSAIGLWCRHAGSCVTALTTQPIGEIQQPGSTLVGAAYCLRGPPTADQPLFLPALPSAEFWLSFLQPALPCDAAFARHHCRQPFDWQPIAGQPRGWRRLYGRLPQQRRGRGGVSHRRDALQDAAARPLGAGQVTRCQQTSPHVRRDAWSARSQGPGPASLAQGPPLFIKKFGHLAMVRCGAPPGIHHVQTV